MTRMKNSKVDRGVEKLKVKSIIVVKLYFILMNVYCCTALCLLKLLHRNVRTDFTHSDNGMLMFRPLCNLVPLLHAGIGSDPSVRLVSDGVGTLTPRTQIRFSWSSSVGSSTPSQREPVPHKVIRSRLIALSPVPLQGSRGFGERSLKSFSRNRLRPNVFPTNIKLANYPLRCPKPMNNNCAASCRARKGTSLKLNPEFIPREKQRCCFSDFNRPE